MSSSLEAFPECWQPLNWSRFEETLQEVVQGQDNLALNARVTYLNITLDCLEASRHRHRPQQAASDKGGASTAGAVAPAVPSPLPQLFLGAGGDRDGRTAVKRCSQWAAKVWAQRYSGGTSAGASGGDDDGISAVINTRVCMAASRALAEALEAFSMVGGGCGVSPRELEGCQLAAVEIESYAEVSLSSSSRGGGGGDGGGGEDREATARCRAGLMRSLGGRPFCPTLAGVLLQNMPPAQGAKGGAAAEVERLKALLRRQQAGGNPSGTGSGGAVSAGGVSARGRGGAALSGSAMPLADLMGAGGTSSA